MEDKDTQGNEVSSPQPPTWVDKWVGVLANVATAFGAIFTVPLTAMLGAIAIGIAQTVAFIRKFWPTDPFRLRTYGETLLSGHVKIELGFLTLLIAGELAWEMFGWSSMWSYSLSGAVWLIVSLAFTGMTFILTRMLLTMPTLKGRSEHLMIARRLVSLIMVAIVLMIPIELRFFRQEIEKHIAAQEDVRFDAILEKAKAYETGLAETRTESADATLSGQTGEVVARRAEELKALIAQQTADRAEITKRLTATSDDAAREAAGKKYGGRGIGPSTILLNRQVADIRTELKEFDAAARKERSEFGAMTEQMRVGSVQALTDAQSLVTTGFDERIHAIETMDRDALAAQYGGTWRLSRGIMDQWQAYIEILRKPELGNDGQPLDVWMTSNEKFSAGVALMMVVYSIGVVFVRLGMTKPTRKYYNPIDQALGGNTEMMQCLLIDGRNGDEEALMALRSIAKTNQEAAAVLRMRGFDGDVEVLGWSQEKKQLHGQYIDACIDASKAHQAFEERFRQLCTERTSFGSNAAGITRSSLNQQAQADWLASVQDAFTHLANVERAMFVAGIRALGWPSDLVMGDPRHIKLLWKLDDDELENEYGWLSPATVMFRNAPTA